MWCVCRVYGFWSVEIVCWRCNWSAGRVLGDIYRRLRQPGCLWGSRRHAEAWLGPLASPPRVMFVTSEGCRAAVKLSRGLLLLGSAVKLFAVKHGGRRTREPRQGTAPEGRLSTVMINWLRGILVNGLCWIHSMRFFFSLIARMGVGIFAGDGISGDIASHCCCGCVYVECGRGERHTMYVGACMHIVNSGGGERRETRDERSRARRRGDGTASVNGDVGEQDRWWAGCRVPVVCYRVIAYRAQAVLSPTDVNDWG